MTTLVTRTHLYHPEWCAVALAAGGWLSMLSVSIADPLMLLGRNEMHSLPEAFVHSAVMTQAMMAPLVLYQVNRVATFSLWCRRYRAAALFLLGYLSVWTVISTVMMMMGPALARAVGWRVMIGVSFGIAFLTVLGYGRQRLVRQCSMTMPLALRGWRADRDCLRFGVLTAQRCVTTCWPLMLAVIVQHGMAVMAAGTLLMVAERRGAPLPPRTVATSTAALGAAALLLAALAESGQTMAGMS
jgi:hypothetical protein